ncbi:MAG: hypothetical protein ACI9MC_001647 [Kiritimatiellia bacterium]
MEPLVSLRDQLMAKGLVSKKRAKHLDREMKQKRRSKQGSQRKKRQVQAEFDEREQVEVQERKRQRLLDRKRREQERDEHETMVRVREIALANRIRDRGRHAYYHRLLGSERVRRMMVSERVAWKLRCGEAAIVAVRELNDVRYVLVNAQAARRLTELEPALVVSHNLDNQGLDAPELRLVEHVYNPVLGPHRVDGPPAD